MTWENFRDPRVWLLAGALACVLAALLVPRIERAHAVYDVLAVVDITGSMNTRDMGHGGAPETRLAAARAALQRLLAELPCGSRFGLGVFTERRTFLLLEPVESCGNFAALDGAVSGLDWRMAWEGDSYVAKGILNAIEAARALNADVVFLTDGHEAPPLPASGLPEFADEDSKVGGLVVGVGGKAKSPIPKYDDNGLEMGAWRAEDVPHENRVGAPPKDAESRPGYHPKWAPFGAAAPPGEEHLSSVRSEHLQAVSARTGLHYVELTETPDLFGPLEGAVRQRIVTAPTDVRIVPGGLALLLLAALYGALPLFERKSNQRRRATPAQTSASITERTLPMLRAAMLSLLLCVLLVGGPALAHGPTPRKVEEKIEITAPPDAVWALVKDFGSIATWHPGVSKSDVDGGGAAGATRVLTLKSGETLSEGLDDLNEAEMTIGYRLAKENLTALPVSFYSAALSVKPSGSGSTVEWIGRFYRGDTSNFPPENLNDEAATKAMTAFFQEGLGGLKAKLESKP